MTFNAWNLPRLESSVRTRISAPCGYCGLFVTFSWRTSENSPATNFVKKGKRKGRSVTTSAPSPPYLADCARCVPRFSRGFLSMMRQLRSLLSETPSGGERIRSEEHTSELQSRQYLVCRLLLEK